MSVLGKSEHPLAQDVAEDLRRAGADAAAARDQRVEFPLTVVGGGRGGREGWSSKFFWSQVDQELADVATEVIGPYSQIAAPSALAPDDGQWEFYALVARGSGIRAGTSEILRNILGERVLGLPKD